MRRPARTWALISTSSGSVAGPAEKLNTRFTPGGTAVAATVVNEARTGRSEARTGAAWREPANDEPLAASLAGAATEVAILRGYMAGV